jgi:hypothetical protein
MSKIFGYTAKDEFGVMLVCKSNNGKDKGKYLEYARELKRPILIQIESEIFSSYKFTNFALTISEAKALAKELNRMVEYLEDKGVAVGEVDKEK